jgi:GAF domain-containing protein
MPQPAVEADRQGGSAMAENGSAARIKEVPYPLHHPKVVESLTGNITPRASALLLLEALLEILEAGFCRVYLLDETRASLHEELISVSPKTGLTEAPERDREHGVLVNSAALGNVASDGSPAFLDAAGEGFGSWAASVPEQGVLSKCKSLLLARLRPGEDWLGLLEIGFHEQASLTQPQIHRVIGDMSALIALQMDRGRLMEIASHRARLFKELEVALAALESDDRYKTLCDNAVRQAVKLLGWKFGGLYKNHPDRRQLELTEYCNFPEPPAERWLDYGEGPITRVAETAATVRFNKFVAPATLEPAFQQHDFGALIAAPIVINEAVDSVLFVADQRADPRFLVLETDILSRFAARASLRLRLAKLAEQNGYLNSLSLRLLHVISRDMQDAADRDRILHLLLTAVTANYGLRFNRAQVFLLDDTRQYLIGAMGIGHFDHVTARHDWERDEAQGRSSFQAYLDQIRHEPPPVTPLGQWTTTLKFRFVEEDAGELHAAMQQQEQKVLHRHEFDRLPAKYTSGLALAEPVVLVPLTAKGKALGILVADSPFTLDGIDPDTCDLLRVLGSVAALALHNGSRQRQMDQTHQLLQTLVPSAAPQRSALLHFADQLKRALAACWVKIILFEPKPGAPGQFAVKDLAVEGTRIVFQPMTVCRPNGISVQVMRDGEARFFPEAHAARSILSPTVFFDDTTAVACLPFVLKGQPAGVAWLHYREPRAFEDAEQDLMRRSVAHVAREYEVAVRLDDHRRLEEAIRSLSHGRSSREVTQAIVAAARKLNDAQAATFWPYDPSRGWFLKDGVAADGIPENLLRARPPRKNGVTHTILLKEYDKVETIPTDEEYYEALRQLGLNSFHGVALKTPAQVFGVLCVSFNHPRCISQRDERLLREFAAHASEALRTVRLNDQLQAAITATEQIVTVMTAGHSSQELTLQLIAEGIRTITHCDAVTVWGYNEDTGVFTTPTDVGVNKPREMRQLPQPSADSIIRRILASGKRIVDRIEDDSDLSRTSFVEREGIKSCLATRLWAAERRVGVLFVNYRDEHQFVDAEVQSISMFAKQAAVAIYQAQLSDEQQKDVQWYDSAVKLTQSLLGTVDPKQTLRETLIVARSSLDADVSHVVWRDDSGHLVIADAEGWPIPVLGLQLPESSYAGLIIRNRGCVWAENVNEENRIEVPDIASRANLVSVLGAPMLRDDEIVGALLVASHERRRFTEKDRNFLELLANQTAIAVRSAQQVQRKSALWDALLEAAKAITANRDQRREDILASIAKHAVEAILGTTGAKLALGTVQLKDGDYISFASLYPTERHSQLLQHLGARRYLGQDRDPGIPIGITGRAAITRKPANVGDVSSDPDYVELMTGIRSEVAAPMFEGDEVVGVLNLESDKPNAFDDVDVAALQALADLAVVAMQREGARENIRLGLSCEVNHLPSLRVSGAVRIGKVSGAVPLDAEIDGLSARADTTLVTRSAFRMNAKAIGRDLFSSLFGSNPKIRDAYSFTRGWMQDHPDRLHLQFECSRHGLRLPVEFLFDNAHPVPGYLALWHPISRCVGGVPTVLPSLSRAGAAKPSSALFIAADTGGLGQVESEVTEAAASLDSSLKRLGIQPRIDVLPDATYPALRDRLCGSKYDIVHYAGHGHFNPTSPEDSCLVVHDGRGHGSRSIPARELNGWLRTAAVRLFYLSCCWGAQAGGEEALVSDDFFGLADAIIQAGVPSVLGFRVPVRDRAAKDFAAAFYAALAAEREIDTAVLRARNAVYNGDADDPTWLSPVLIEQDWG